MKRLRMVGRGAQNFTVSLFRGMEISPPVVLNRDRQCFRNRRHGANVTLRRGRGNERLSPRGYGVD